MYRIIQAQRHEKNIDKFHGLKWDQQYLNHLMEIKKAGENGIKRD